MTKPAITKRSVKGAALTYAELDTNFQNLKDATINITAGTGGTSVSIDLNGNLTLVAGTGITLSGDNTAKTLTINTNITGTVTNPLTSTLNTNGQTISSGGSSNIIVDDDILFPSGTGPFVSGAGQLVCRGGEIKLQYSGDPGLLLSGAVLGTPGNTSTPVSYLKLSINGSIRYLPLYN